MAETARPDTPVHALSTEQAAARFDVDPARGLSAAEAAARRERHGPNQLQEGAEEPRWRAFLRQYRDFMQIILLIAAAGSVFVGDRSSAITLVVLTIANAILGLRQESKAEESIAALRKLMKESARVRREGEVTELPAEELVPGDVVIFEAGDRIPADGRLLVASTLEVEEAALTGESAPVLKDAAPIEGPDVAIGDRLDMGFMQSTVTRGRGEMLVTATGMDTEIGHIAGMLQGAEEEKTPLTRQIDQLTLVIAGLAGLALLAIVGIGLSQGDAFSDLFDTAIALAIAAIPTGMPVVVTSVLAIGTMALAERNAIVKRLPSVETLGSTSAICSDKTGTLTMNQMTARQLLIGGGRYTVSGEGYRTEGAIQHVGGLGDVSLDPVLLPMVLCSDAVVRDGDLTGDPTEGALVVLAEKGGLSARATREAYPRVAEVPFDSAYKLMATCHEMEDEAGRPVVRMYVKGAPDVILDRSTRGRAATGETVALTPELRSQVEAANEGLAAQGMRVLVVASRDLPAEGFARADVDVDAVRDLTLLAMVGIVDPPRAEARDAIEECRGAGIRVRMITGDHVATAAAIASELGIEGQAISGSDFQRMSDEELRARVDDIGVVARVAPEDKVRLVQTLKDRGQIVAMTGDGVNDAPALKTADIGVAMGITGTDVSKEAADMILTDDNFATIVGAIEQGRELYDNLLKYIRFQMAGLVAFILAFLGSALFDVAGTALFLPLQILWVNFVIQAPIGMALGVDTPTPGLMERPPRPADSRIMTRPLALRLLIIGGLQALATLWIYQLVVGAGGDETTARTAALTTFTLINVPVALNLRYPLQSTLRMEALSNPRLLMALGWTLLAAALATELGLFQRILETSSLSPRFWAYGFALVVAWFLAGELAKWLLRALLGRGSDAGADPAAEAGA